MVIDWFRGEKREGGERFSSLTTMCTPLPQTECILPAGRARGRAGGRSRSYRGTASRGCTAASQIPRQTDR